MQLSKYHDPAKNNALLTEIFKDAGSIDELTSETNALFQTIHGGGPSVSSKHRKNWLDRIWALLAQDNSIEDPNRYKEVTVGDEVVPEWKTMLDREYDKLEKTLTRSVNIEDFGAVGDGVTDCTNAFNAAFSGGYSDVYVPKGIYIVRKIEMPSFSRLRGEGKGASVLKLHDQAPKRQRLVSNANPFQGNKCIAVENIGLDWNVERFKESGKTSAGNNFSSCLTFANVKFGWVKQVAAINPGLHCFDVSSTIYNYGGDGKRAKGGSEYIWIDRCNGYGFGDDGVTTHHSDYIFISNSHFCDPSGRSHKAGFSNSNGIEIDDGSRFVWLLNNSTARCFGGVEIKAHATSSAATGVFISGHLSVNDNRSFNFRHIGHHKAEDPDSMTAFNIRAQRLVAVAPVSTKLYAQSTPRALVVSGYRNVVVNRFFFIGDRATDYRDNPAVAIQYKAKHIALSNGTITGFRGADADILVAGGSQSANDVAITRVRSIDSSKQPLKIGKNCKNINKEEIYRQ